MSNQPAPSQKDSLTAPLKPGLLPDLGPLTKPLSLRGWPTWVIYALAVLGIIYILNPGAGFLEFIPDNIPIIGNIDEGVAFMLVWYGLVEYFEGRKYRQTPPPSEPEQ